MAKGNYIKIYKNKRGSALLVAVIVMGVLLTLSLGVSDLLIGTMRDSRILLEKTQAWYAAESGVEQALFSIYASPPGFEEDKELTDGGFHYSYKIAAKSDVIPVQQDGVSTDSEDSYSILRFNESVAIPLFAGTSAEGAVRNFRVDYYLEPDLLLNGGTAYQDLDILRWKIFGINARGEMEMMSDYFPMMDGKNVPNNPTCFSTNNPNCNWNGGKFYENTADGYVVADEYLISRFLNDHTKNFLALTNLTNADLVGSEQFTLSPDDRRRIANIRYRVVEEDSGARAITLPTIKISSDGFLGETKQSIDLNIKREGFLPVFNFALYRATE